MATVELRGLVKQFPGVLALDYVDLELFPGEVHALMGENGAGKSSLIKVLTGLYSADEGEILVKGQVVNPRSPAEAVQLGISTVYQEVNLAPNLSVAENIALGREPKGAFGIHWRRLDEKARGALDRVGLKVDPHMQLRNCSIAVQQMVAIARALDVDAHTLVLDEPTSSLDQAEVDQLFTLLRKLRDEGLAIVFVTHFLDQVYAVSDRITVLRNGRRVGSWPVAELPRVRLVSEMIGRDEEGLEERRTIEVRASTSENLIEAESAGHTGKVQEVSFKLQKGSVLGLAGLLGSGRTETLRLLFGLDSVQTGTIEIFGKSSARLNPLKAIRLGLAYTTEDRKLEGILPELSVRENMTISLQAKQGWFRPIAIKKQKVLTEEMIKKLGINLASMETPIQLLSGGNQQKVLLARWLIANPKILLLDEPTRGIDIGAKFEILSLIESLREGGMSFVFVSSELNEVVKSSDTVLVFRDRKMVGKLVGEEISEKAIIEAVAESTAS